MPPAPDETGRSSTRLSEMFDELLAEGEVVDTGTFSVDAVSAAEKRASYQFGNRYLYLLAMVEAFVGFGASTIAIEHHGIDLTIEGVDLQLDAAAARLAQLDAYLGSHSTPYPWRRLALGVAMVRGLDNIERVCVELTQGGERVVAEHRRDRPARIKRASESTSETRLRVVVDRDWTKNITLRGAAATELDRLREVLRPSSTTILVDGDPLTGSRPALEFARQDELDGVTCEAGFDPTIETPSAIEWYVGPIMVDTTPLDGGLCRARVSLRDPRRDLSGIRLARTPEIEALEQLARQLQQEARQALEVEARVWDTYEWKRPERWQRARLEMALGNRPVPGRASVVAISMSREAGRFVRRRLGGFVFGVLFFGIAVGLIANGHINGVAFLLIGLAGASVPFAPSTWRESREPGPSQTELLRYWGGIALLALAFGLLLARHWFFMGL